MFLYGDLYLFYHQLFLLGLLYEDMSWEYAEPCNKSNKNCIPCLFMQFQEKEQGECVSKILQIFSREVWYQYLFWSFAYYDDTCSDLKCSVTICPFSIYWYMYLKWSQPLTRFLCPLQSLTVVGKNLIIYMFSDDRIFCK